MCAPNFLRFRVSRDSGMRVLIVAVTAIGVLSGVAPAFAEPGPSALAYPPPFIDHAEWTQWHQLPSLRVYPTRSGRDAARQLGSSTPAADEAAALGVCAVCVSPSMVPNATHAGVLVAAVAGFPSGKHLSELKAREAAQAIASGAGEIDMVIDVGSAVAGDIDAVRSDIAAVRAAVPGAVLKVIVESAALLTLADERTLTAVCRAAEEAGADFVKTSTGFHPAGGASVAAVGLVADAVGGRLGVKA